MPTASVLIVTNPESPGVRRANILEVIDDARRRGRVDVLLTRHADHARTFCAERFGAFEKIIVAGGDGLLNEVVDGCLTGWDLSSPDGGRPVPPDRPMIAPLPAGSGNDYVKALPGYPAALRDLLDSDDSALADVGRITFTDGTTRYFLSEAGAGMDAACVRLMPKWLNRRSPAAGYNVGGIRAILSYRPYSACVTLDGVPRRFNCIFMLAVANTTYFGDGMMLAPDARFDDGRFHVVIVQDAWRLEMLMRFKMIRRGTHVTHPKIIYEPCRHVEVQPDRPLEMCVDGDYVPKTPAHFESLSKAIRVVRPGGISSTGSSADD
ncbi:MAG: diacylglycerol kinase family lipid kinase [Phycisphaerae bacterium]|nr:diacylglycerol kinase family lipid kinase [Phycisphaerae bacterium]